MNEQKTFYRPGLVFFSKHTGYQDILTRDHTYNVWPDGTREIARHQLVADFADHTVTGSTGTDFVSESGVPLVRHNSAGGVFDLDATAAALGWDDGEKETAARVMLNRVADPAFHDYDLAPGPMPVSAPWPTYDDTHHFKIPVLAEELGLVGEALAYERGTKNREGVVKALEEKIGVPDESLAAA